MALDAVAIATAFLLLDDIAGLGQLRDDSERAALGDAERRGDVAQARPWILSYAHEGSGMVGEEGPFGHEPSIVG